MGHSPVEMCRSLIDNPRVALNGDLAVIDPSSEMEIARLIETTAEDLDQMVGTASRAQLGWAVLTPEHRAMAIEDLSHRLFARQGEFATLEALDSGNPIESCRRDVDLCARYMRHWSALARGVTERKFPVAVSGLAFEDLLPYGVVGAVLAYNKPLLFAVKGAVPALLMGNGVVLKPAPQTSLIALAFERLLAEVLPEGLVQVALGGAEVAKHMARHPRLRRLAFTGSARAALALQREAARAQVVKSFTYELGGVNTFIAIPDMTAEIVASGIVTAMSLNTTAGQSCQAMSRLAVSHSILEPTLELVAQRFRSLRLGVAYDKATEVGPLVSADHRRRVFAWVEAARQDGGQIWEPADLFDIPEVGYFFRPVALVGLSPSSRAWATESFGPVLAVTSWRDEDEVVALANSTGFGLTASVWGKDFARALRLARRLTAGYVWVNTAADHVLGMPFGGMQDSGTGREEALETLLGYVQSRSLITRFPDEAWGHDN